MIKDLTTGSPAKLIFGLSISFIIGNVFQYLYSTVDALVVGRVLGSAALAAVGATGPLTFLIIGFSSGVAGGFGVVIGQYFGAKNEERLKVAVTHVVYLGTALMLILTPLSCILSRPILALMNTPDDIIGMSNSYLVVMFAGMFFSMAYNAIGAIFRALGDSKTPLYILIFTCLLNVVLDIAFVAWWKTGVAGAAYASVIAQAIASLLSLWIMIRKMPIVRPQRRSWKLDLRMIWRLFAIGAPMGFQTSITALGTIPVQIALNRYGSAVIAAMTASGKVTSIFVQVLDSVGVSMAYFCAQNIGAGQFERMKRGVVIASGFEIVISVLTFLLCIPFGVPLTSLFIEDGGLTEEMAEIIRQSILIQTALYPVLGFLLVFRNAIQGAGYSAPTMIGGVLELFARSASVLIGEGIFWIYFAGPLAWIAAAVYYVPMFFIILARIKKKIEKSKRAVKA